MKPENVEHCNLFLLLYLSSVCQRNNVDVNQYVHIQFNNTKVRKSRELGGGFSDTYKRGILKLKPNRKKNWDKTFFIEQSQK